MTVIRPMQPDVQPLDLPSQEVPTLLRRRRKRRAIRTTSPELAGGTVRTTLDIPLGAYAAMKILAAQRKVSLASYLRDVLCGHTCLIADFRQKIFIEMLPPGSFVMPPPERWAGYLASLGFAPAVELAAASPLARAPAPGPPPHAHPLPPV